MTPVSTRELAVPVRGATAALPSRGPIARGLLSSSDVGSTNRGRVLQALVDDGPASRADLARRINVPRATISSIVTGLLDAGILQEDAPQPPTDGIGKPPRPLWFAPQALLCGAISVGRGAVEVAVVNARGEILVRAHTAVGLTGSTAQLDRQITAAAASVLTPFIGRLSGVGLTVPALCNPETMEVVACTPVPALVGTRLPVLLQQAFRRADLGGAGRPGLRGR